MNQFGNTMTNINKRLQQVWWVAILLVCIPITARADAGTPLMWAAMAHLVIGNFFFGMFEAVILVRVFKLKAAGCMIAMIAANYFSAWGGGMFLSSEITKSLPLNLYNAWHWLWAMVAFTFLMTLVLEWPFVFFCFRKEPNRFKRSLWGNLLVNSISYILLFSWYWMASGTTLYTKMKIVQPSEMTFPKQGLVYFISETNGTICRLDLGSHRIENVCDLKRGDADDRLFVKASVLDTNTWDILDSSKKILVISNLQVTAIQSWRDTNDPKNVNGTWFNFGEVPKLGTDASNDWRFETGFWPIEGFHGNNSMTGETIFFSLETPFVAWVVRNATQLPDDFVVFQLGDNQICLFQPQSKKIALLTKGHGPVVVIPNRLLNKRPI